MATGMASDVPATVRLLSVTSADGEFVIGRGDLGAYIAVPEPGAILITALQEGCSLTEATARASAVAGEDVDGADFLDALVASGLLDEPGAASDSEAAEPGAKPRGRQIRWIEGVSPATARRLFGRLAWSAYLTAAGTAIALLALRPDLRPSFDQMWFLPDPVLSMLMFLPVATLLLATHEAWHWLAGRAIGIPATFRFSNRGPFLVFETDLTQIVTVPRRRRYGPFLAGMAFDVTVLAVALLLRLAHREDLFRLPFVLDRLLGVVVLFEIFSISWQVGAVFLRSDVYAVVANALKCHDLYRVTWLTNKRRLWRLTEAENTELTGASSRDRAVANWFGVLYLVGLCVVAWFYLRFAIPFVVSMATWAAGNIAYFDVRGLAFWESLLLLAYVVAGRLAAPLLALRGRRLRREGVLR
ncbi:hypothetical protein [Plantactinospora sp. GCM10030261]|uniref:hypothetical protein n=1 Tax=Plantactinospora sp. GCM10030261 TaxID=3273420 RepID=UPI003620D1A2